MTLNGRNKLLYTFGIGAILIDTAVLLIFLLRLFLRSSMDFHLDGLNLFENGFFSFVFSPNPLTSVFAVAVIALYAPALCLITRYTFEKTQSAEMIYFGIFLLSCLVEVFRLFIPIFNLWHGYSLFLIYIGKFIFTGRLVVVLSFLFAVLFSSEEHIQDADRNLFVIYSIALTFAAIVPVESGSGRTSIMVSTGYDKIFIAVKLFIVALTAITLLVSKKTKTAVGFFILYGGYSLLIKAESPFFFFTGITLLLTGTKVYLKSLHDYYLWK